MCKKKRMSESRCRLEVWLLVQGCQCQEAKSFQRSISEEHPLVEKLQLKEFVSKRGRINYYI